MRRAGKPILILLIALGQAGCASPPIRVERIDQTTDAGPVRGWVAEIDLTDPAVDVVVTAPLDAPPADNVEAIGRPTDAWLIDQGLTLAVNANYFGVVDGNRMDIVGLSISDGRVVSPPRRYRGRFDPALLIDRDGRARVVGGEPFTIDGVHEAVAGVGGSPASSVPGTVLVRDGVNLGATARVAPLDRHPRTAVGVDRTGRRLIVMVIDGRQPDWSVGATLPELATLMIDRGTDDAINLDGGGSSAFVYDSDADGPVGYWRTNRPSDGAFRPVANHLGIRWVGTDGTR